MDYFLFIIVGMLAIALGTMAVLVMVALVMGIWKFIIWLASTRPRYRKTVEPVEKVKFVTVKEQPVRLGLERKQPASTPESILPYNGYVIESRFAHGTREKSYRIINPGGEDLGMEYLLLEHAKEEIDLLENNF